MNDECVVGWLVGWLVGFLGFMSYQPLLVI